MKWRICMMTCVSMFIISFPQNMIGCGPGVDPYDYYSGYFSPGVAGDAAFRPFYYTGLNFLYDESEPELAADVLATEWAAYCGVPVTDKDAKAFVTEFSQKDVSNLYFHIEKNQPLKIPDSLRRNSMTNYFLAKKDLEALGYIIYAKKTEPYVTGDMTAWEPIKRDSAAMGKLTRKGLQLYAASKSELFKLKYAYQVTRLAHYSGNFADAILYYDTYMAGNKAESILHDLGLGLKAGALYRLGNGKEAAYLFSKVFANADVKKVSNYMSFKWAVDPQADRKAYLKLCKNDKEKADMLALFALGSPQNETATLATVYNLDPGNKAIEVLSAREINKLEEKYFTPVMNREKGGSLYYYTYTDMPTDSTLQAGSEQVRQLAALLESFSKKSNPSLNLTAAAYAYLMVKDFSKANALLSQARKNLVPGKVNDQWMLTNLLLTINETVKFDRTAEEKILPSVKWLQQKAKTDKSKQDWSGNSPWKIFYRNIMAEALAKKYHAQGDIYKEVLAIGAADHVLEQDYNSLQFLRNKTDVKDVEQLYALMVSKSANSFENFLLNNNSVTVNKVTDFAGTAYLRNYNYTEAIAWLQKAGSNTAPVGKDPFIDLLYDLEEAFTSEKKTETKLSFAKEMLRLQTAAAAGSADKAKLYYKLATGMYNMTYYGHAWELVQYDRSGSDGYSIPAGATEFQRQYYGCFAAHDMFRKAMEASADREFKARCLFMMAKCAQKNVARPQYNEFPDYDNYVVAEKAFFPTFMNNKYFPQLQKEYGTTTFYQHAESSCSYLRDYLKKSSN